jgi:hypothetical protein
MREMAILRNRVIVETVADKVPHLTVVDQVASFWPKTIAGRKNAMRQIVALERLNLLHRVTILIRDELAMEAPVVEWRPGLPDPQYGAVAYRLQSRWRQPVRSVVAIVATRKARAYFGVTRERQFFPEQCAHNHHLAVLYLRLLRTEPEVAARWCQEPKWRSAAVRRLEKLPDVGIYSEDGTRIERLIEHGGNYDRRRVERFHDFARASGLPYTLW